MYIIHTISVAYQAFSSPQEFFDRDVRSVRRPVARNVFGAEATADAKHHGKYNYSV